MGKQHSPAFLALVQDARSRIREVTVDTIKARQERGDRFLLFDVREDLEWQQDHIVGAEHLGKGILERDIEARVPDKGTEIVLYCGGGFRSALAADALQKMGYTNIWSMDGGIRVWRERSFPLTTV